MYIKRYLKNTVINEIKKYQKIIIIYGARQTGKTTLVKEIIQALKLKTLFINADEQKYIDVLSSQNLEKLQSLVEGFQLLVIDEAQRINNIGINLKILIDNLPQLKIIVTGSSSFELANKINEPLTGRVISHILYPLSNLELVLLKSKFELKNELETQLIYGFYPEIYLRKNIFDKKTLLENISQSYLYKDALELVTFINPHKIRDLLKLLAFQVGQEVSILELSNRLSISRELVEKFLFVLEKSFIIFRLTGFSRNLRKEIYQKNKFYFYDLGIRNVLIDNLKPLKDRNDVGQLWENFLMVERKKYLNYKSILASSYFWRTYTGAEIDYIEERDGKLYGYEFKFNNKNIKPPQSWLQTYKNSLFKVIKPENYLDFIV